MKTQLLTLMAIATTQMSGPQYLEALDGLICPTEKDVLLLNDTSSSYTWGSYGSCTALREEIKKHGFSLKSVSIGLLKQLGDTPLDLEGFEDPTEFEVFKEDNLEFIKLMADSDIIILNGAGTIHGTSEYTLKLLYIAYIAKTFLNKTVMIVNHSCYPQDNLEIDNVEICKLYSQVYNTIDYVAVREILSSQLMRILHVENRLSFDMLPLYIEKHYNRPKLHLKEIVIGGSAVWNETGMKQMIRYMKQLHLDGYTIKVLIGAKDHIAPEDRRLVQFLKTHHPSGWELVEAKSMNEWLDTINHAALVISGRYHFTTAAMSLKTPFITLNGATPYNEGLQKMTLRFPTLNYDDPNLYKHLMAKTTYLLDCPYEHLEFADLDYIHTLAYNNIAPLSKVNNTLLESTL